MGKSSTREKGKRFERRIRQYLESLGWTVDVARAAIHFIGPGKCFSSQCDFFGCADLICIKPDKPYTLFIQAHAGEAYAKKRKDLELVKWSPAQRVQLWVPQEGILSGVRVFHLSAIHDDQTDWSEYIFRVKDGSEPPQGVL